RKCPPIIAAAGSSVNCIGKQIHGSVCEFTVDTVNYTYSGALTVQCVDGMYNSSFPTIIQKCAAIAAPQGATVDCVGKQAQGTICHFIIDTANYTYTGSLIAQCVAGAVYNTSIPLVIPKCAAISPPAGSSVNCIGKQAQGT